MKSLSREDAKNKAAYYCSMSEKCEQDVRLKLRTWDVDSKLHDFIIEKLINEKFIDEERYSIAYVKDKFRFNNWGRLKIIMMLKSKGISTKNIDVALLEIDEEEYIETLKKILITKLKTLKYKTQYECNGKLIQYALGKGFEMDVILTVLPS